MMMFQSERETQYCVNYILCFPLFLFLSIVARIALVKPEKARGVEDVILRAAQMGQIVEKVQIQTLIVHNSYIPYGFYLSVAGTTQVLCM